jgi:hypothetical protein
VHTKIKKGAHKNATLQRNATQKRCNAKAYKYRAIKAMKACQCYGQLWEMLGLMVANDGILILGEPNIHVCKT